MQTDRVRFRPPPGFTPPEGIQQGDTFDIVDTYRPEADGYVCLVKMGDSAMPGYSDHDGKESPKPDYGQYAKDMQGQMPGPQEGAPT